MPSIQVNTVGTAVGTVVGCSVGRVGRRVGIVVGPEGSGVGTTVVGNGEDGRAVGA